MATVKHILAAIDFSKYAQATLRFSASLSEALGAKLTVLNVIHQRDVDSLRFAETTTGLLKANEVLAQRKDESLKRIDQFIAEAQCGHLPYEKMVLIGTPWDEILNAAQDIKADLVIIGTRGRGAARRNLLGSNADKVYKHCPVSVLSVRGEEHAELVCQLRPS